jgi:magnesium chelatase family protein
MRVARVASRAQLGLEAPRVNVEVHLGAGLPTFTIVGMPETAVRESKERVRAALANCGFEFPAGRITVNLSPADLPKEGCRYDLPIALGILLASGQRKLSEKILGSTEFYGELGLAGELRPIRGVILAAAHAAREGRHIIVPAANAREARLAAPDAVRGALQLQEVCDIESARANSAIDESTTAAAPAPAITDLADVRGQAAAKRALIVAAAGGHSLLLIGPPGTGKTMLAQRLPGLLPPLTGADALDVASIASVSRRGFDPQEYGRRPFRSPHHSTSAGAIIGGGPRVRPGEVSLAHRGVLFLDELPEFRRDVLESLREPMESGVISISRASLQLQFPARFQLVAAMNPCPCGHLGDASANCRCPPGEIARYRARISGPLLDRIDLRVEVPAVPSEELLEGAARGPETPAAAARVLAAREAQLARAGKLNSELDGAETKAVCQLDRTGRQLVAQARSKLSLSARGVHRVMRVARTIADLDGGASITVVHLAEALQLRRAVSRESA